MPKNGYDLTTSLASVLYLGVKGNSDMEQINSIRPTGNWQLGNKLKPTEPIGNWRDSDLLFEQLTELVNPQYRQWYCGAFNKLGKQIVLKLASEARADGKAPRNLFSFLLKKELKTV